MATVTFVLKKASAKKETPVFMVFLIKQKRIRISTGIKIHPKHWNKEKRKARETSLLPSWESINNRLETIKNDVMKCFREHQNMTSNINIEKLRADFEGIIHPKVVDKREQMTFMKSIVEYIHTTNKKEWTIKHYITTKNTLTDYQEHIHRDLDFEDINIEFYDAFMRFMEKKKKFALNTCGTHIKNIKIFMNNAIDREYTIADGHLHKKFRTVAETSDSIYLNEEELKIIYDLDLSKNNRLEQQRDLFIIGCYTGLRFSDLAQLQPENIIRNRTRLRIKTAKTGEIVEVPLKKMVINILEKYEWELPKSISDQKMNDYLKEIGQQAGLTEKVVKAITRGGSRETKHHEKWELIMVHTARRSFATNAYLSGVPTISIMKLTGHTAEKSLMKYIKISQEQNADLLSQHPFFS